MFLNNFTAKSEECKKAIFFVFYKNWYSICDCLYENLRFMYYVLDLSYQWDLIH